MVRPQRSPLALALACSLSACTHSSSTQPSATPSDASRQTLFSVARPGAIWTHEPGQAGSTAEAMLVAEGKVVALGSVDQLRASAPAATLHELGPVTVLPGFIDAHVHVRELGFASTRVNVESCPDEACMVARLREAYPAPEPGAWLVGEGWDEGVWTSRGYPSRAELDAAFPQNPVFLASLHGFAGLANAAALRAAGIEDETADPEGGTIVRDARGHATGVLLTLAQGLVRDQLPPPSLDERAAAILAGLEQMAAAGVTSVHEAGMKTADAEAFEALAARGQLPIRVYGLLDGNDDALVDSWLARGPMLDAGERLAVRGFKVFYDGSLGSRTALLSAPYADDPHHARPTERISPARIEQLAQRSLAAGFQLAVHTIGDEANTRVLDLFEATFAAAGEPRPDHRWRLEHAQVMAPGDFERAARLGVIANMQPSHAVGDSVWAEQRLGPERVTRAYAWRSFLDAGALLVLSSDLPGEPWTPMQTLYFALTRQDLERSAPPWFPEQALSVDEALYAMGVAAAYAGFAEGRLGQLCSDAWADFVVLDADPRAVEAPAIPEIEVLETWVAGERVSATGTR